jgi:ABC-type nitrate/sulfonate/bicarbonate transport system substrate-binding protein
MNGGGSKGLIACVVGLALLGGGALAYKHWAANHGPGGGDRNPGDQELVDAGKKVGPDTVVEMPFIFWGGDVATFHANGGLETRPGSLFARHGLKVKLTPGDDFDKQVDNYLKGKSPFLRGTLSMLGQASDKLTEKPEACPVVFLQLTWSAGDHLVGRPDFRTLNDLKGKKIALQEGGPHVGMLNDILRTVKLDWKDVTVVWTKDVNGDKGPAALFRKDPGVDACFAISPEMFELTSAPDSGGVDATGDGTKKSIKGAHVVVSTAHMSRSIADVYACRRDFYVNNREWVEKVAAGYLKACEDLVDVKKRAAAKDKAAEAGYQRVIKLAQDIWGKDDAFKDAVAKEADVDGLISDASFVGLPGNESFFTAKGNLSGFAFKQAQALVLPGDPSKEPLKQNPRPFQTAAFDYPALRKLGDLHGKAPTQPRISAEAKIEPEKTIYTFTIRFKPDTHTFSAEEYGKDFERALEQASLFGNAVVAIQGHADPSLMVRRFLQGAKDKGLLKGNGPGAWALADGKKLDPKDTPTILALIDKDPGLTYSDEGGRGTLQSAVKALQDLSERRAEEVRKSVVNYAGARGLLLEQSQIRSRGVGVREPVDGFPTDEVGFAKNRRVEFRIIKVPADKVSADEFDL